MGLNIKLMVHGVPQGQKKWGADGDDNRYLSSFYGPKWDVPEVVKVELITLGQQTNCYYTFLKGQNVCDVNGRSGSYIALTLKVNAFYVDGNNIYNLLKAAYEKMCVGSCVSDNGQIVKYLIADFNEVAAQLGKIESCLKNYIHEFSVASDVVSFSQLRVGQGKITKKINLAECTPAVALDSVQESGTFLVSPYFSSSSVSAMLANMLQENKRVKEECQNEIKEIKEQLAATKADSQKKINLLQMQFEQKNNDLENQYKQEIKKWKTLCSESNDERDNLKKQIEKIGQTVKETDIMLHNSKKELEPNQKLQLKQQKQEQVEGMHLKPVPNGQIDGHRKKIFVCLIVVVVIALIIGFSRWIQQVDENNETLKSRIETLESEKNNAKQGNVSSVKISDNEVNYKIDIKEFSKSHKCASKGDILTVRVNPQEASNGSIKCDGLKVIHKNGDDYKIAATKAGKYTIVYLVDGIAKTSRTIEVKE